VNLSANLKLNEKKDVVRLQGMFGEGVQNYMNDAPVDVAAEVHFGDPTGPSQARSFR